MFGDNGDRPEVKEDENEPHHNHDVDMLEIPQGFPGGCGRCLSELIPTNRSARWGPGRKSRVFFIVWICVLSSVGRAADSKSAGRRFEAGSTCHPAQRKEKGMPRPYEDLVLDEGTTAEELATALDRRNAEVRRVVTGILDGSIALEPIGDEET